MHCQHRGRIVKTTGDGLFAEFGSVVDAVRCAVEVQTGMAVRNTDASDDQRLEFRIGINVGEVVEQDGDIFGDGVNIAARLEGIAEQVASAAAGAGPEQVLLLASVGRTEVQMKFRAGHRLQGQAILAQDATFQPEVPRRPRRLWRAGRA